MNRLSHRDGISTMQVYTRLRRQDYNKGINRFLLLLSAKTILHVQHRPKANLPIYSAPYLKLFFSRFGDVEAVLQVSYNCYLVVFNDAETVTKVVNQQYLGAPTGRLLTRRWDITQDLKLFYSVVKLLEKSSQTCQRFSSLMDRDDLRAMTDMTRHLSRTVVNKTKSEGYSSRAFFCPNVTGCAGPLNKHNTVRIEPLDGMVRVCAKQNR